MSEPEGSALTRRRLLAGAGAAGVGLGLGASGYLVGRETAEADEATGTVPFYGPHQAGIATAAQDRLHFAAFDLTLTSRRELRDLLREWSDGAARMTAGQMVGPVYDEPLAPTDDTGETLGLPPASSPSPSASGQACSSATARTATALPAGGRLRSGTCRRYRPTSSTQR